MIKIFALLKNLQPYFTDSKTMMGVLVVAAMLYQQMTMYVDKKHVEAVKILDAAKNAASTTEQKVARLELHEVETQVSLRQIERSLNDVASMMRVMDQRLWEVYKESRRQKQAEQFSAN